MVYADEVNDPFDLAEIDGVTDTEVSPRELKMASQLIESLTEPFEPDKFEDTYRSQVLDLVERKAAGEEEIAAAPAPAAEEKVVDLMTALEASVKEAKASRTRHPTAKKAAAGGDGDAEVAAEEARPAKRAAKSSKRKSA